MTQHLPVCHLLSPNLSLQNPAICHLLASATLHLHHPDGHLFFKHFSSPPLISPDIQSQVVLVTVGAGFVLQRKVIGTNCPRAIHRFLFKVISVRCTKSLDKLKKIPEAFEIQHFLLSG